MMTKYTIYTENKNRPEVEKFLECLFDGATIHEAKGLWKTKWESTLVIDVVIDEQTYYEQILKFVQCITILNDQESIMVEKSTSHIEFL